MTNYRLSHTISSPLSTLTLIIALEHTTLCLQFPLQWPTENIRTHTQSPTLRIRHTFLHSDHRIRLPSSFPPYAFCPVNNKSLLPITLHSNHATQQLQLNRYYNRLPAAVNFNCPSTMNCQCHTIIAPLYMFWPTSQTTFPSHKYLKCRHTLRNFLASPLRLQQKTTSKNQNCPHSTSTLTLVQPSVQVKCTNASISSSDDRQQRSPLHAQPYLFLSFSHSRSLPLVLHFQFRSAIATS